MYRVVQLKRTCTACPSQWEGLTDKENDVYIRYRWGRFSVDIDNNEIFCYHSDEPLDGFMSTEDMMELTKDVLEFNEAVFENGEYGDHNLFC